MPNKKFISLNEIIISLNEIIISLNETTISFNEMNFFSLSADIFGRGTHFSREEKEKNCGGEKRVPRSAL